MIVSSVLSLSLALLPQGTTKNPGPVAADDIQATIGRLSIQDQNLFELTIRRLAGFGAPAVPYLAPLIANTGYSAQVRNGALQALAGIGEKSMPALDEAIRVLADDISILRAQALILIGKLGPQARKAFPVVVALRKDEEPMVRRLALYVGAILAEDRDAYLPEVIKGFSDPDPTVRDYAAQTVLELYRQKAAPYVDTIAEHITFKTGRLGGSAQMALASIGDAAVPKLLELLGSDSAEPAMVDKKLAAIGVVAIQRPVRQQCLDAVVGLFRAGDDAVVNSASLALRRIGAKAVEPLSAVVLDENLPVSRRVRALDELGTIGNPARGAGTVFAAAMRHEDPRMRRASATAVGKITSGVPGVAEALIPLLDEPSREIRMAAARAIGVIGAESKPALPKLLALLASGDSMSATVATQSLGLLRDHALPILPDLLKLLESDARGPRMRAVQAIAHIGPAVVPQVLASRTPSDTLRKRRAIILVLHALGPRVRAGEQEAVSYLMNLIGDDEEVLSRDAALALGRLGPKAKAALPKLIRLVNDASVEERIAGLAALASIAGTDPAVVAEIEKALAASSEDVRWAAIEALGVPGNKLAIPILVKLVSDENAFVRMRAATSLGRVGQVAREAVPALEKQLRRETETFVTQEVARAVRTIMGLEESDK